MARRDKELADLLDQFVCVRIVQGNGLDLALFQFDFDLTWAVVMLNADRTVYARYASRGTRHHGGDNSLEGLRKAMQGALDLHKDYPNNKKALAGKQPGAPPFATPEKFPTLKARFTATLKEGKELRHSCLHCHQIGEAIRAEARKAGKGWTDEILFPYPMPEVFGVELDAKQMARVTRVAAGSAGAKAGLRAGDDIVRLDGQPIVSIADVQWVLHRAKTGATLTFDVKRAGKDVAIKLPLAEGWRRSDDPHWRTSTWELRRLGLGGMQLEDLGPGARKEAGLGADALALRIRHVGAYAPHNVAQKAGFRKGDVLVAVGKDEGRLTEFALIARMLQKQKPGDEITFTVLRGGKRQALTLRLP